MTKSEIELELYNEWLNEADESITLKDWLKEQEKENDN